MDRIQNFISFLFFLGIEFYIGLYVHDGFIRPYIGDVLIVPVLYFLARTLIPTGLRKLSLFVLLFAVLIEIGQYFHFADLLGLRENRVARIILGSTFDFTDILCYFFGFCGLLVYEQVLLNKISNADKKYLQ